MFVHSDEVKIDPAGPRPHLLPRRPRQVAHDGREPLGRRLAAMVPQRTCARPTWPRPRRTKVEVYDLLDRRGRGGAAGQRGAVLPALSLRRADAARRSRRPRLLRRPDARPQPRPPDPRDHGRRDLFDARQPGDFRGPGRADPADSRLRRRLAQPACGGRSRPTSSAARWSRSTARKGPAYGVALLAAVGAGRVQEHRRGLRGHDPRRPANRPSTGRPRSTTTGRSPSISSFTAR